MTRGLRATARLARLAGFTICCVLPHLIARRGGRPSPWPRHFLAGAAKRAGFDVKIAGQPLEDQIFLVANHISWVDILALGGATGCAFIARDDVEHAPIVGWLARQNNSIFVAREKRGAVAGQVARVRAAMAAHQPVALFPEGTTGDGVTLRPFKPALFAVLSPPPRAVRVQPVLIDYGAASRDMGWAEGESGLANARRILGRRGRTGVTLHLLAPFDPGAYPDRKALAAEAKARIATAWAARQGMIPPAAP